MKTNALIIITISLLAFSCKKDKDCVDTNCSDYSSQSAAQRAFESDPECHSDLDADNDCTACEEDGNSVTDCPTTSACGCSGLNMAPCNSNVCCEWTTGSGCDCAD